jgi:uncharacterized membrane protein YjjP (DUF1212 family)
VVSILQRCFALTATPAAAYAACALMVIPGVPLLNAVQDMIKGHLGVALARALDAGSLIIAATLGLLLGLACG